MRRAGFLLACAVAVGAADLRAQSDSSPCRSALGRAEFATPSADLARLGDISDPASRRSFLIRRYSDVAAVDACALPAHVRQLAGRLSLATPPARGVSLLPVQSRAHVNSSYPRDWNDGALWSGRGLSMAVTPGVLFSWGIVEAAVAPTVMVQQNASFDVQLHPDPAYSPYIHRWHGRFIDMPQRFGTDASARIDPGQSYVRLSARGVRAGLSTENLAWGPAQRNPLLLSGTSAGFAHMFLETSRPHDIRVGDAAFQLFWGRLSESEYFDHDPSNDHRAMTGMTATITPRGLDGLHLGISYLHTQKWSDDTGFGELISAPFRGVRRDSAGLPRDLRLFALSARWVAAPGGFEVYGEWARQDSWDQWFRLVNEVQSPQAYSIGLQKLVRRGDTGIRFTAEISHLADAVAHRDLGRGLTTYYVSTHVTQGHTHRGQLLGAPIGPGSEAQFIGADVFWRHGRSSLSIERARYDDDAYYTVWGDVHGPHGHDTEMSFRAGHLWAAPGFSIDAEVGYSFRYNRALLGLHHGNSPDFPYRRDSNIGVRVGARWVPPQVSWRP